MALRKRKKQSCANRACRKHRKRRLEGNPRRTYHEPEKSQRHSQFQNRRQLQRQNKRYFERAIRNRRKKRTALRAFVPQISRHGKNGSCARERQRAEHSQRGLYFSQRNRAYRKKSAEPIKVSKKRGRIDLVFCLPLRFIFWCTSCRKGASAFPTPPRPRYFPPV